MKNIVFVAPPAAGKGTQSDLLVKKYGYKHISTGDLLRGEVASGSVLGKEIETKMKNGELISDEIVNELLFKALDDDRPFILDGYPRNSKQIEYLEEILNKVNKNIGVVIYLNVPESVAVNRACGRMICPNCNATFHKTENKPKVDGICDNCASSLIVRGDDNEETFKVRFNTYIENAKPILDYYNAKGLLQIVDKININEVSEEIEKVIM